MAINAPTVGSTYEVGRVSYTSIYEGILEVTINSVNIESNSSDIRVRWLLRLKQYDEYNACNYDTSSVTLQIDGRNYQDNNAWFDMGGQPAGSTDQLTSRTLTVYHDANGSKTISIGGYHDTGLDWGRKTIPPVEVILPNIARASTIASMGGYVTMDGVDFFNVKIKRASTAFTHKVVCSLGSFSQTISNVTESVNIKVPLTWNTAVPNSTSAYGTVTITTFNGSRQIGNPVSANIRMLVPGSIAPKIGTVTPHMVNGTVPPSWGIYVQGKSAVQMVITAEGSYGSKIKQYNVVGDGFSGAPGSADTLTSNAITGSGTISYTATVTDSRGRTDSATTTISVQPYTLVNLLPSTICERVLASGVANDEGTYLLINPAANFSSCSGKNTMTIKARYKQTSGTFSSDIALTAGTATIIGGGTISADSTYQVDITATDAFSKDDIHVSISTSAFPIDCLDTGDGVAFGKSAELKDTADFNYKIKARKGIDVDGAVNAAGGTLTGNLGFNMFGLTKSPVDIYGGNSYGVNVAFGGGAVTIIGGGESAEVLKNETAVNQERMIIGGDNAIEFYSNMQNGVASAYKMVYNGGALAVPNAVYSPSLGAFTPWSGVCAIGNTITVPNANKFSALLLNALLGNDSVPAITIVPTNRNISGQICSDSAYATFKLTVSGADIKVTLLSGTAGSALRGVYSIVQTAE